MTMTVCDHMPVAAMGFSVLKCGQRQCRDRQYRQKTLPEPFAECPFHRSLLSDGMHDPSFTFARSKSRNRTIPFSEMSTSYNSHEHISLSYIIIMVYGLMQIRVRIRATPDTQGEPAMKCPI
jgi:hypothetical protein